MPTKLTPIRHPILEDHHRVPVAMVNGKYEVYVEENFVRIYEPDDLPDLIKIRMAMIRAATKTVPSSEDYPDMKAYELPNNSGMYEIGWQAHEYLYMLILPSKYLTCLRGEVYDEAKMYFMTAGKPKFKFATYAYLEDFIGGDPRSKS
jgi:hypothetical protein